MLLPLWVLTVIFGIVSIASLYDMTKVNGWALKSFRLSEALICFLIARDYWIAYCSGNSIPSTDLRYVLFGLGIIMLGEILSRQSWGKKHGS
jgi:hypothetical protein